MQTMIPIEEQKRYGKVAKEQHIKQWRSRSKKQMKKEQ